MWRIATASGGGTNDLLTVNGNLFVNASSGNPLTIMLTSMPGLDFSRSSDYSWVLASAGSLSGFSSSDQFTVNTSNFPFFGTGTFSVTTSSDGMKQYLDLVFAAGVIPTFTWTGSSSTAWTTGSNWLAGSNPDVSDTAIFTGALVANQPVLSSGQTVGGLSFESTGWTISGSGQVLTINSGGITLTSTDAGVNTISTGVGVRLGASQQWNTDPGNTLAVGGVLDLNGNVLTKVGTGTVQLGGSGASGGGTLTINEGTVATTADGVLGSSVAVNINGATLDMGSHTSTVGSVTMSAGTIEGSGSGRLNAGAFNLSEGVVSAILGGGGNLTKTGGGTLAMNAAAVYGGSTLINGGVLQSGVANALPATTNLTISSGTFAMGGNSQTVASLAGSGSVTLGAGTLTVGGASTFSGPITGSTGGLVKTGTGTLVLTNPGNLFSGPVAINGGGAISIASTNNIGDDTNPNSLSLDNGGLVTTSSMTMIRPISILAGGGTLDISGTATLNGALSVTAGATLTKAGGGTMTMTGGTQTYGANSTVAAMGGVTNFGANIGSSSARNLNVTTSGTAAVNFSGTSYLKSLSMNGTTTATIASGTNRLVIGDGTSNNALTMATGTIPTSRLEINNGGMVVRYTSGGPGTVVMQSIFADVKAGWGTYNPGPHTYNYDGTAGITSNQVTSDHTDFAIGVVDNGFTGGGVASRTSLNTFLGQTVLSNDVLVRYTVQGDLDLNGVTNGLDYLAFKYYYSASAMHTLTDVSWQTGDFNGDGKVNVLDYAMFKYGYSWTCVNGPLGDGPVADLPPLDPAPEPATLALLAAGGLLALARQRRRA